MSTRMKEFVLRPKQTAADAEQKTKDHACDSAGVPSKDVGTLQDSSGERIGEAANRAFELWTKNSLLKQVNATDSNTDASGEEGNKFIIAGCCKEGRLLGLRLSVVGTEISKFRARDLARDEEAVFVVGSAVKIPAWITDSYSQLVVKYDSLELKEVYIAKLQCSKFDPDNHYQLLQTNAAVEAVSDVQWEEAIAAGDRGQQSERIQVEPLVTAKTEGKRDLMGISPKSGVDSWESRIMKEHLIKGSGNDFMPSAGLKPRGVNAMFDDMGLGAILAARASPSASFEGWSEAFVEGRKRKFSGDSEDELAERDEADNGEGEADEREDEADDKKKKKKLKLILEKPSAQEHSDIRAGAPGQMRPKIFGAPKGEPIRTSTNARRLCTLRRRGRACGRQPRGWGG